MLIDEWRKAWRFLSVQVTALAAAAWSGWWLLPPDTQASLAGMLGFDPAKVGPLVAFAAIIIARLKAQNLPVPKDPQ